jgi:hypothetical protein
MEEFSSRFKVQGSRFKVKDERARVRVRGNLISFSLPLIFGAKLYIISNDCPSRSRDNRES